MNEPKKPESKPDTKPDTVKGLENIIVSLKKSGFPENSKEVSAIRELIKKQK